MHRLRFLVVISIIALSASALRAASFDAAIARVQGNAEVLLDGIEPWQPAKVGQQLTAGTQVRTPLGGEVIVLFFDGSKVRVGPSAQFKLESAAPSKIAVYMGLGRLEAWVSKMKSRTFQARSPSAVASVRGTVFALDVGQGGQADVQLFSGSLALTDSFGRNVLLSSGQGVTATSSGGFTPPKPLPPAMTTPPIEPPITMKAVLQAAQGLAQGQPGTVPPNGQQPLPGQQQPAQMPAQTPPDQLPVDQTTTNTPPPLPPPSPTQNQLINCPPQGPNGTVSPSAPCPQ